VRGEARILVGADAKILEASDPALKLLGLTLEQLKGLPPGALSVEQDQADSERFREAWEESGRGVIVGAGTVRRLDGTLLRLRYLITPQADGNYEFVLDSSPESVTEAPRTYTVGNVLSAWRAAERKLATIAPQSSDWVAAQAEIKHFRDEYRRVVRERSARPDPG